MMDTTSDNIEYIALDVGGSVAPKTSNPVGQSQTKSDPIQTSPVSSNQAVTDIGDPGRPPQADDSPPHIIGDFDSSANALWRLYEKETSDPEKAHVETLKGDMERVFTFTSLFAVVLTAFIIESKQNLKVNPQDQMVYYLQQNVAMLDQISRQISFIAPQFPVPSTPPTPFPDFKPSASDIRVNVYWFMALVFNLSAVFLATLVQQSVRDYMDVFQRYSDPLKSARLREYMYEGLERWCMTCAEAIPGFHHVSLFLFFIGLCDFLFNINTTIGLTTTIPIVVTGLLYIAATVAPLVSPQLPYRTSFSGIILQSFQEFTGRRFKIRGPDGVSQSMSSNMVQRQMQYAMAETKDRERRDTQAIQRLLSKLTYDTEIESLLMAILGSFSDGWGLRVWRTVLSSEDRNENTSWNELRSNAASDPRPHTTAAMRALSERVGYLLDTCENHGLFKNDTLWRRRTRACVETVAVLVIHVDAELGQFGDIDRMVRLLGVIGDDQRMREASFMDKDRLFVMRWTCLSLVAIRPVLESNRLLHQAAEGASQRLQGRDYTSQRQDATRLGNIIDTFNRALWRLDQLSIQPTWREDQMEERVQRLLQTSDALIEWLEQIDIKYTDLESDDSSISRVQDFIDRITYGVITRQLPGVKSDLSDTASGEFSEFVELFHDPHPLLFIFPLRNLRRIHTFAQTLRDIHEKRTSVHDFLGMFKKLQEFKFPRESDHLFHRQMYRLQELQDGSALGFTVELFFLALKQLLSNSSSAESDSALFIGTFHAITASWSDYKDSLGTQKLLLGMVVPEQGIIFRFSYPPYIVTAFLAFLGNILEGQTGDHIREVRDGLTHATRDPTNPLHALSTEVLRVIPAA